MNSADEHFFRIAMINAADEGGGAESVARGLRTELVRKGHTVDFWVGRRNSFTDAHAVRVIPATDKQRAAARRYADHGFFNLGCPAAREFCESPALGSVDLIHLHNLHGHYFSITDVPRLAARAPLVWTLHDFFPITGGCAFPNGCERWRDRCGQCPQLGEYPLMTPFDRTRRLLSIKRHTFRELRATLVVPSEHLARAVRSSGLFPQAAIEVFPYGVDTTLFRPGRVAARKALGLPTDKPIIMLAAQSLTEKRKNASEAVEALAAVQDLRPTVILIGGGDIEEIRNRLSGCDVRALGYVANRDELARCYAAADLLLFTSRADNFPCVIQESFACGTTVLAQSIDATREMIVDGETGFLVPVEDTGHLARALRSLISNRALLAEAGAAARDFAERHWSPALNIKRHEALYARVVGSREMSAR